MVFVFWTVFFIIVFHYLFFPAITVLKAFIFPEKINKEEFFPFVSLIIAAYNEEKIIEEKIKNSFLLDYPKDRLEIIIVSDGSTDKTPDITERYQKKGIKTLFEPERRGKTSALNRGVEASMGEILIFSDANSMYKSDSIKMLVRNLADQFVGGVCGRKSILDNAERESSEGDSMFWSVESFLKTMQSLSGSISNGDGEIFAVRRSLCKPVPEEIINDDQAITFNIIEKGYRVVYEPEAVSYEEASIVLEDDLRVKARMVSGGYQAILMYRKIFLPPKSYFALQFISHKFLRYTMPVLLIIIFISNLFVIEGIMYLYFFYLQLFFYSAAGAGYFLKIAGFNNKLFYVPLYYCLMNFAALKGLLYFLRGDKGVTIWKKAAR